MATKAGYEGLLYCGTAGTTATTLLQNVEDLNYDNDVEKIPISTRGDGTAVPIKAEKAVEIGATISWGMLLKTADTNMLNLIALARAGTPVALRTKSFSTGKGYDGDAVLTVSHEMTLKGQSKFNFTATPNDELRVTRLDV